MTRLVGAVVVDVDVDESSSLTIPFVAIFASGRLKYVVLVNDRHEIDPSGTLMVPVEVRSVHVIVPAVKLFVACIVALCMEPVSIDEFTTSEFMDSKFMVFTCKFRTLTESIGAAMVENHCGKN